MRMQLLIASVALVLIGCASPSSTRSSTGITTPAQHGRVITGHTAILGHDRPLPVLPQPSGAVLGTVVPDSELHGTYAGSARVVLPGNANAPRSSFKTPSQIIASMHFWGHPVSTRVVQQATGTLMSWSQINTDNFKVTYIAPTRQVYEFQTTYNSPFYAGGNLYSSGQVTSVVDAQTGQGLYTRAAGTLTQAGEVGVKAIPCTPDSDGYCAVVTGTSTSGTIQCLIGHVEHNYPQKIVTTYGLYQISGELESATQTATYTSGPPCPNLSGTAWSPGDPKEKYNDPNLP